MIRKATYYKLTSPKLWKGSSLCNIMCESIWLKENDQSNNLPTLPITSNSKNQFYILSSSSVYDWRRCNTVLETSLAVRDPSPLSYGRCASDPRGFDVEKRRTYAEPSRRALPVPITKSSSHRRRVRDPCRAAGAFINSRRSRDHNREMRRRHDLNWSCGV